MVIQSMPAACHEAAQLSISRIRDVSLIHVRQGLNRACAEIYRAYLEGRIKEQEAYRALIHIQNSADQLSGVPSVTPSIPRQAG